MGIAGEWHRTLHIHDRGWHRSGASDVLVSPVGQITSLAVQAPPGTYFVRIRAANACVPGGWSRVHGTRDCGAIESFGSRRSALGTRHSALYVFRFNALVPIVVSNLVYRLFSRASRESLACMFASGRSFLEPSFWRRSRSSPARHPLRGTPCSNPRRSTWRRLRWWRGWASPRRDEAWPATGGCVRAAAWAGIALVPLLVLQVTAASAAASDLLPGSASSWADVLFSSRHGFLSWTPVVYVAVVGTVAYFRRDRVWAIASPLIVLAIAWRIAADDRLAAGPAFGARGLLAVLALLAPGLALILDAITRRPALALAPMVLRRAHLESLADGAVHSRRAPEGRTSELRPAGERPGRRLSREDARSIRSPFLPTSGLRGVSSCPPTATISWHSSRACRRSTSAMDRRADQFLLEGWDAPGVENTGPVWWTGGRRATIAVPLALPADRVIEIVITARSRFEEPVVEADVLLQLNDHDVAQFAPAADAPREFRVRLPAPAARVLFREGFNRVSFVSRGVHRAGSDGHTAARAVRYAPRSAAWPVAIYRIKSRPWSRYAAPASSLLGAAARSRALSTPVARAAGAPFAPLRSLRAAGTAAG